MRDLVQGVFEVRRQSNTDTVLPYIDALSAVRLGLTSPDRGRRAHARRPGPGGGIRDLPERRWPRRARSTSTSRSTGRSRSCSRDPEARSAAQGRCRHLLVDEFQDLNPAHMLLIRLLCAPAYNCFGVGDDDQVIYGYAGATPEYLINFGDYFPGAQNYALEVNYRCPPAVVGAATSVLSYNVDRIAKTIRTPARPRRRRSPTSTALSRARAGRRGEGTERGTPEDRAGGDRGLGGRRRAARRDRGADPGELVAAPGPDRAGGGGHPLQRAH